MSQNLIADSARNRMARAVELVEASLSGLLPFDPAKTYTPKELEPYDALSDRFVRATEAKLSCGLSLAAHFLTDDLPQGVGNVGLVHR